MTWIGLDIGGANLKAASSTGWANSLPFALWRDPDGLAEALRNLIASAPVASGLAVTMTGELCDCFSAKGEGVDRILSAVESIASGRQVSVFLVNGQFVCVDTARKLPQLVAASNWRAIAEFVCRFIPKGDALLIDIGSTTCDIVPIIDGNVAPRGLNDPERLVARELVYSGVGRTPICALVEALPWRGDTCPVAAEFFATTADAYLLLGGIAEEPDAKWTADGRPLTFASAQQRLARQICADATDLAADDFDRFARAVYEAHVRQITDAVAVVMRSMPRSPEHVVVSGVGEFLATEVAETLIRGSQIISLTARLGPAISRCAPAYALAVLAREVILQGG